MTLHWRGQQYEPAVYDSPLEDHLVWHLSKLISPTATLAAQMECPTPLGKFRADFALLTPEQTTIIECDGRDYHLDDHRDHVRDLLILQAGHAEQVIRLFGDDVVGSLTNILHSLAVLHPSAFDERGRVLARRAAAPEIHHLTRADFDLDRNTQIGGTLPGRRWRHAVIRRHALNDLQGDTLAKLQAGNFTSFTAAVEGTRFRL